MANYCVNVQTMMQQAGLRHVQLVLILIMSILHKGAQYAAEGRHLEEAHLPWLSYHGGPLLTSPSLTLHLLWYGTFPASQQAAIADFISSFDDAHMNNNNNHNNGVQVPSVASWWLNGVSLYYTDSSHARASAALKLGSMAFNPSCSIGKGLTRAQISWLLEDTISKGLLPAAQQQQQHSTMTISSDVLYVVFTAADVLVESFCMSSCGYHGSTSGGRLPFIWVGNAQSQCLGLCAWPFAVPRYGPRGTRARVPPNGEAATDGMIINLATLLAGAVTNPFATGYFPPSLPPPPPSADVNDVAATGAGTTTTTNYNVVEAEAATACAGMFGKDSYPGFPGNLLMDTASGATYNALGSNGRRFLLPSIWNPASGRCQPPST